MKRKSAAQKTYAFGSMTIAVRTSGVLKWVLTDHLGSTSITANANGSVNSEIRYSAFGEVRYSSGTTPTDYQYTNQLNQADIGLYYYVARFYDPVIAHFVQADTIVPGAGNPAAYDRYAYVFNNSINYNDPSGHNCSDDSSVICVLKPGERAPFQSASNPDKYTIIYLTPTSGGSSGSSTGTTAPSTEVVNIFVNSMGLPTNGGNVTVKFGAHNTMDSKCKVKLGDYFDNCGVHAGVDISDSITSDLYAVYNGVVVWAQNASTNGGTKIVIMHSINQTKTYSVYYHVADPLIVVAGDPVEKGQIIGTMGNTGASTIHLHFEARTQAGMGPQPDNGSFQFPLSPDSFWANSANELHNNWIDISSRFGGYDNFLPLDWRKK